MSTNQDSPIILLAEDDDDDYLLAREAFMEVGKEIQLKRVHDGEELMGYLMKMGTSGESTEFPRPSLILLDLNMPRMDGHKALSLIKADQNFRRIPITILTTSQAKSDILTTYELGCNSFLQKAILFPDFVDQIKSLFKYWMDTVKLPNDL